MPWKAFGNVKKKRVWGRLRDGEADGGNVTSARTGSARRLWLLREISRHCGLTVSSLRVSLPVTSHKLKGACSYTQLPSYRMPSIRGGRLREACADRP